MPDVETSREFIDQSWFEVWPGPFVLCSWARHYTYMYVLSQCLSPPRSMGTDEQSWKPDEMLGGGIHSVSPLLWKQEC